MVERTIRVAITEDKRIVRTKLLMQLIELCGAELVIIPRYLKPSSVHLKKYRNTDKISDKDKQKALNNHLVRVEETLGSCDVVILPGNKYDIPPRAYGQTHIHKETRKRLHDNPLDVRFETETCMANYAINTRPMPILAICGGMQVVNVLHGGSLVQHLPDDPRVKKGGLLHRDPEIDHILQNDQQYFEDNFDHHLATGNPKNIYPGTHGMRVEANSYLGKVLLDTVPDIDLNNVPELSIHHQGIFEDNLGEGLVPVAFSPDGVIEAYEIKGHPYPNIFTQFHVECNVSKVAKQVVKTLINAAR